VPVWSHPSSSLSLGRRPGSCLSVGHWTSRRSVGGMLPKKSFLHGPLRCCCGPLSLSSLMPGIVVGHRPSRHLLSRLWHCCGLLSLSPPVVFTQHCCGLLSLSSPHFSFFIWLWAVVPPSNFYLLLSTAPYCLFFFQVSDSICNACIAAYNCAFPPPPPTQHIHPQTTESPSSVR
jgi:hypothetical protein